MNKIMDYTMREAEFFSQESGAIRCGLCPHGCLMGNGQVGICRQRANRGGNLSLEGYGKVSAMALDPIEKKPLYHFYPGRDILSIGGIGCNFKCEFCQNWGIAHDVRATENMTPEDIVDRALELGSVGIAYTYNEPLINYEYVYDTAKLGRRNGLKNVLVTNGYINRDPLENLLPYIDAMNIDVKAFNHVFYRDICAGSLEPVMRSVEIGASHCHIEVTTLIIDGLNDSPKEMEELAGWLSRIDGGIPLHISRYFPNYKMDRPATKEDTIIGLAKIARTYLDFVYIGNMPRVDNNTYCPDCKNLLVKRSYRVNTRGIEDNRCKNCGYKIRL